jgi:hypothetical protein
MRQKYMEQHLVQMERNGIEPNFFCSLPYWFLSDSEYQYDWNGSWIVSDSLCMIPPLGENTGVDFIWSDFNRYNPGPGWYKEFLDWEYLYDPCSFQDLSGKKWRKFRKNCCKWADTHEEFIYTEKPPNSNEIKALLLAWFGQAGMDSIQDPELIYEMSFSHFPGIRRKFIKHNGQLFGINIWDSNYKYVNYRFCIPKPGEPFLDECMRNLFYTDSEILQTGKLVNDGGSLGNKNLEWFKDKLNPIRKRAVYSWKRS